MRFYDKAKIGSQYRINLRGVFDKGDKVVLYFDDDETMVAYIARVNDMPEIAPHFSIRTVDDKCRIMLPSWLVKGYGYKGAYISCKYKKRGECTIPIMKLVFYKD